MDNVFIFDNVLDNIDSVRERALLLKYTKSEDKPEVNWKGYRCLEKTDLGNEVMNSILKKLPLFIKDMEFGFKFHYSLKKTDISNKIHKDGYSKYAGVLYLNPSPAPNSGTLLYSDDKTKIIETLDNVYNRLVIYPSDTYHSLDSTFGHDINDGRLTFIIFCLSKNKNIISLI
jgi:hypothetical protein